MQLITPIKTLLGRNASKRWRQAINPWPKTSAPVSFRAPPLAPAKGTRSRVG
jgi:hypothetical protein